MVTTTLDILYLSLATGFVVLVIFLSITLLYTIFILRDVSSVTQDVKEVTERVNQVVISPLKAVNFIIEQIKPHVQAVLTRASQRSSGKKSKRQ
jgi:hypothetical protein